MTITHERQRDTKRSDFHNTTVGELLAKMEQAGGDIGATAEAPGNHKGRTVTDDEVQTIAVVARGEAARRLLTFVRSL